MKSFVATALFAVLASAFTPPGKQTYGALLTPNTQQPITTGQTFTITWQPNQPADGVTVSLVLCKGPSTNCVIQSPAIVEGVQAGLGSYSWNVPCSLPAGTQNTDTGYGMLIIVDGTGEFQYSTQFSVLTGSSCSSTITTTTTSSSTTSSSSSSTSQSSTSSKSSSTSTTSVSSSTASNGTWNGWSTSTYSTTISSKSSSVTPVPVSTPSYSYMTTYTTQAVAPTSSAPASSSSPRTFTGAAALPTAFVNAAGVVGAAVLGMMAL